MIQRVKDLCRRLQPVLGQRIDRLWQVYMIEDSAAAKAEIEQMLELMAARHLGSSYAPDHACFVPPNSNTAGTGDIALGTITNGSTDLHPLRIPTGRLREHILVAGRSGSGKTNSLFILLEEILKQDIHILALDWKRGYRDLFAFYPQLRVYTIGRDVAPFRFNPLIPPVGCEPGVWIKLIVDVIAGAYLGGEGVISLLVAGLDKLYRDLGIYDGHVDRWPTIKDLLAWLRSAKLKGRAAMWQASAERILLALCYGEFGKVLDTQDNCAMATLLDQDIIMEMDGLSGNTDRIMFSEALTLYLYRLRLARGPQKQLTNMIVIEEAHNLLHKKASEGRESVLESSIRMIRQYGIGYVFVDQSASLLSQVAFANCFLMLALSQKLKADVQTMAGAMNLTDEQKQALNTLERGTAVVRLADGYTEPFLLKIPLSRVQEGSVTDAMIRQRFQTHSMDSRVNNDPHNQPKAITPIPISDNKRQENRTSHRNPQSLDESRPPSPLCQSTQGIASPPPIKRLSRDAVRFIADIAARPTLTTVKRYQSLHLSRRRGNAIRQDLAQSRIIAPVPLATRSGQIVLYQLTELGLRICHYLKIDPGPQHNESLEHRYWVDQAQAHYRKKGYELTREYVMAEGKAIDLLAQRPGERLALEIETGKSDIDANIRKSQGHDLDRLILIAVNPSAVAACQRAIQKVPQKEQGRIELITWLDLD